MIIIFGLESYISQKNVFKSIHSRKCFIVFDIENISLFGIELVLHWRNSQQIKQAMMLTASELNCRLAFSLGGYAIMYTDYH